MRGSIPVQFLLQARVSKDTHVLRHVFTDGMGYVFTDGMGYNRFCLPIEIKGRCIGGVESLLRACISDPAQDFGSVEWMAEQSGSWHSREQEEGNQPS
jgi:hypothetical protein